MVNHTTPLPIGNLNTTAYKPAVDEIVETKFGDQRVVLYVPEAHVWKRPLVWIGCTDGTSIELVSPDELTPVGLAVL